VIDLVIGYCYAAAAFFGVSYAWNRLRLPSAANWTEPRQKAPVATGDKRSSAGQDTQVPLRA
jgi:hypothetical protein